MISKKALTEQRKKTAKKYQSEVRQLRKNTKKDTKKAQSDKKTDTMEFYNSLPQEEKRRFNQELQIKKLRDNYLQYLKYVYPDFIITKFHTLLAKICQSVVQKVENGETVRILLSVPPQHGKGYPVDFPILTTKGWKNHGDLKVGDYVYNDYGQQVKVLATQEPYMHPCMKVTFTNGESHIVTKEHLWKVLLSRKTRRNGVYGKVRKEAILETQVLAEGLLGKNNRNPSIPINSPLENARKPLPVDPYVLGLWLGDGLSSRNVVVVNDTDLLNITTNINDTEIYSVYKNKGNANVSYLRFGKIKNPYSKGNRKYDFTQKLDDMGLINNKHIPVSYLLSSKSQRFALLNGLMDSDGYVSKRGDCEYISVNKELAENVFTLLRSLSVKANIDEYDAKLYGRFVFKKYRVTFRASRNDPVFRLKRKQKRISNPKVKERDSQYHYYIKSIEPVGEKEVSCISVERGMYLAGKGLIPTHNSTVVTKTLPSWYVGRNPTKWSILSAYNADLAEEFSDNNRQLIRNHGKTIFGIEINSSQDNKTLFQMHKVGEKENPNTDSGIMGVGILGGIVGHGGSLVIVDDPYKNDIDADSPTYRANVSKVFKSALLTRARGEGNAIIVIHTRWHSDDLIGELEKTGDWLYINVPAENEGRDRLLNRRVGETLCPELGFGVEWLERTKRALGKRLFNANYQGKPFIDGGNIIKRSDIQFYDKRSKPGSFEEVVLSCDLSFGGTKRTNDPYCMTVWGRNGGNHYLLNVVSKRASFTETNRTIRLICGEYPQLRKKIIERKANGQATIDLLGQEIGGFVPFDPRNMSKVDRLHAVSPYFEAHNVFFPTESVMKDIEDYIDQLLRFPNTDNDDFVDTVSQYLLNYEYRYGGRVGVDSKFGMLARAIRGF